MSARERATPPDPPRVIRIAAAVLTGADGRMLVVRKRGAEAFMQPGGKIEPGERPLEALARELREELGLAFAPAEALYLGRICAPAVNEPGFTVEAEVYEIPVRGPFAPAAEIEEAVWIDIEPGGAIALAPLTRDRILPALRGRQKPPAPVRPPSDPGLPTGRPTR